MNPDLDSAKVKMQAAVGHFQDELKKLRTGRAHASMLDGVIVTAYGAPMPLNQVANVTAPEAQLLQVTPFDPNNLTAIVSAIRDNQSLGFNPSDDGRVIRVPVPALTEERRKELVKQVGEKVEECMITLRNIRHDFLKDVDEAKKSKTITEDDVATYKKQVDDAMAKTKLDVDAVEKAKAAEIMTV